MKKTEKKYRVHEKDVIDWDGYAVAECYTVGMAKRLARLLNKELWHRRYVRRLAKNANTY